jgi:hypothetical protein
MRRFADFYNQCAYYSLLTNDLPLLSQEEMASLNEKMNDVKSFHYREIVMRLAYEYKEKPGVVEVVVENNEEEDRICVCMGGKKIWIPLSDTYYEEPIVDVLKTLKTGEKWKVECFGIHKNGKASLRLRI